MSALLHRIFASWRFPAATISLLVFYKLLMLFVLLVPASPSALGQFAEEFKTWCFGYDPATGSMEPMYVVMMLSEPVLLSGIIALIWGRPLRQVLKTPRRLLPYPVFAALLMATGAFAFWGMRGNTTDGELPFPADRLRTAYEAPSFLLVDHDGKPASLADHEGQVVVLTGVYATCGYTCPMIMGQARRALAALPEDLRDEVTVLAVTLDPEKDDVAAMARMAAGQGVAAPRFRLLSGDSGQVNALLDGLGIARKRNENTGVIDHANVFLVVDRKGRIAYRFSLGERQENWLTRALEVLAQERAHPVG